MGHVGHELDGARPKAKRDTGTLDVKEARACRRKSFPSLDKLRARDRTKGALEERPPRDQVLDPNVLSYVRPRHSIHGARLCAAGADRAGAWRAGHLFSTNR